MAEFTGKYLKVVFNDGTNHELPQLLEVTIDPEGGGVERIEVTHAGDDQKEYLDGIPDVPRDVATIRALDVAGTASYYRSLYNTGIAIGTMTIYPEGDTAGNPKLTASGYLLKPTFGLAYNDKATVTLKFLTDKASGYKFTPGTVT